MLDQTHAEVVTDRYDRPTVYVSFVNNPDEWHLIGRIFLAFEDLDGRILDLRELNCYQCFDSVHITVQHTSLLKMQAAAKPPLEKP